MLINSSAMELRWSHIFGSHENTETFDDGELTLGARRSHIFGSHENTETLGGAGSGAGASRSHIFGSHENTETGVVISATTSSGGHISSVHTRTLKRILIHRDDHSGGSHIFGSHENTETPDNGQWYYSDRKSVWSIVLETNGSARS